MKIQAKSLLSLVSVAGIYSLCLITAQYVAAESSSIKPPTITNYRAIQLNSLSRRLETLQQLEKQRLLLESIYSERNRTRTVSPEIEETLSETMNLSEIRDEKGKVLDEIESLSSTYQDEKSSKAMKESPEPW